MDWKSMNYFTASIKVLSLIALIVFFGNSNAMPGDKVLTKNITSSENIIEVNPRFVGDGSNIVFLEYQNTTENITPWDYRLVMCDRNGYNYNYLTETGVIDYELLPGELAIQYLLSEEEFATEDFDEYTFYNQVDNWELWQLDLKTNERKLVDKSDGRLLNEGYKLLGGHGLPDYYDGSLITQSPDGRRVLRIQIEGPSVNFYEIVHGAKKLIHSSAIYKTYGDIVWLPQVIWQNKNSFITLDYQEAENSMFRIISIDLSQEKTNIIYQDENIEAFPRMNLNEFATELYFLKQGDGDSSELWRVSLTSKQDVTLLYKHDSQIGTAFPSMDGGSIVFSQLMGNDFDIVRLDFSSNKIQRLTAN